MDRIRMYSRARTHLRRIEKSIACFRKKLKLAPIDWQRHDLISHVGTSVYHRSNVYRVCHMDVSVWVCGCAGTVWTNIVLSTFYYTTLHDTHIYCYYIIRTDDKRNIKLIRIFFSIFLSCFIANTNGRIGLTRNAQSAIHTRVLRSNHLTMIVWVIDFPRSFSIVSSDTHFRNTQLTAPIRFHL